MAATNRLAPLTSISIEQEFETDKLAILDIRAKDSNGRLLNIEMQKTATPALRERLVYYAACLCSGQLEA